uniref:Uncharacterized protein n=1 Tax=Moniliophthora roreri TaxID=221103 RepID=A0A0W0FDT4_MONRR
MSRNARDYLGRKPKNMYNTLIVITLESGILYAALLFFILGMTLDNYSVDSKVIDLCIRSWSVIAAMMPTIIVTGNEEYRALWQQQTAADREAEDQRRQQEIEDAQLKAEEEKKQEEETLKEKEKKRAKLHPIDLNKGIDCLLKQLHPYARAKLQNCEFVPLWYCLPEATKEVFNNTRKLTEETEFSLTKDSNSTLSVKAMDSAKPSSNAHPNLSLSWTDIS